MLEQRKIDLSNYFNCLDKLNIDCIETYDLKCKNNLSCEIGIYKDKILNNKDVEEFISTIGMLEEKKLSSNVDDMKSILGTARLEMIKNHNSVTEFLTPISKLDFKNFIEKYISYDDILMINLNINHIIEVSQVYENETNILPEYDQTVILTTIDEIFWIGIFYPM